MTKKLQVNAHIRLFFRIISVILATIMAFTCLASCNGGKPNETESSTPQKDDGNTPDAPVVADPKKRVAITFDDGPQYANGGETRLIVDELLKYGFTATFFVVGNRVASNDDALTYAVANGNEIGIHGFTHQQFYDTCTDSVYKNELENTRKAIQKAIPGYEVKTMRPVGGRITEERIAECPYAVINWSIDSDDWNNKYASGDSDEDTARKIDTIVNNVMSSVSDGDIILMHDIWSNTYDAIVILLARLDAEGYEVVSVSELLGDSLVSGKQYFRAE